MRTSLFLALTCLMGCASGPQVMNAPSYHAGATHHQSVLILPLATSSELRDDRTDMVLRDESIVSSYKTMCERARRHLRDIKVQCVYDAQTEKVRPTLRELMLDFAHDEPPPPATLAALAAGSSARYVLFFRPESVAASRETSHGAEPQAQEQSTPDPHKHRRARPTFADAVITNVTIGFGKMVAKSFGANHSGVTTSRSYTVSALLLDLQLATATRYGVHMAEGENDGEEYPEPAPILAKAMYELTAALVDD